MISVSRICVTELEKAHKPLVKVHIYTSSKLTLQDVNEGPIELPHSWNFPKIAKYILVISVGIKHEYNSNLEVPCWLPDQSTSPILIVSNWVLNFTVD